MNIHRGKQHCSVFNPYHFDTDPDPGSEKIRYGSGSRPNFDTDPDPDPGNNDTDPDPGNNDKDPDSGRKGYSVPGKSL